MRENPFFVRVYKGRRRQLFRSYQCVGQFRRVVFSDVRSLGPMCSSEKRKGEGGKKGRKEGRVKKKERRTEGKREREGRREKEGSGKKEGGKRVVSCLV